MQTQQPINLSEKIMMLSLEEREQLFRVLSENIGIFRKIMPGSPMLDLIAGHDIKLSHPIADHYNDWVQSQE